ncbi:calcium-activated chloride channel regulator 1-like isoform X1 [Python bivittatus]|uniref:Calcium-activated chloride channel regulator 1-like isoform X1 n=2 Tax=Python bivittatus TaxID=176946 RepID=A0A9F2PM62_PYTBI|nr:calcium-activated chloride channel regulator 1-like isoform X1 [Python bivittatus]
MGLSREILVVVVLLPAVMGTMIKLNNGGFEDIVIAINPMIPEDNKMINNIKDMVKEASSYLFNATKQRFYFKSVKIVIPLTWSSKQEYKRRTLESYEQADIIIANPYLKYGDEPYTLQFEGCGSPGRYIHFTQNFLTNDNLLSIYGPRGRVLVHEWAHLRWGVFDEYNYDAPFYDAGQGKFEATRCSADVTGKYIFPTGQGEYRKCKYVKGTKLYESGCLFVPEKIQSTPVSIMYSQSLPSVTQFCDQSNHNTRATNMQNKLCDYRSTWEVIMNSKDFFYSSPINTPPPDPIISLVQAQDRVLCLVLDVSGSMSDHNRIGRLKQAAELFLLQIIETGSWVGIVTFQTSAHIEIGLQQIVSDNTRQALVNYLPTAAGGGTNICAGVLKGFQVFTQKYPSTEGCEIVLLTDGEDTTMSSCFGVVKSSGSKIHTIALGPSAAQELEMLATMTGGLNFAATDSLDSNSLIDAFTGISSGSGNISQQSIQLESKSNHIDGYQSLEGTVSIDYTVGSDTFFVVTWTENYSPPVILLTDPKGKTYSLQDFVSDRTNLKTARLKINGIAEVGDWTYKLHNKYPTPQVLSITVTTRPASPTVSPVIVKPYVTSQTNSFPYKMIIYAEVSQGFLPVIGANVTAIVESDSGTEEQELWDNGSGADIIKHDGIYSRYFTSFRVSGRYNIKVRVQGQDAVLGARQQGSALYVPGWIENGEIKMNAPRLTPNDNETQANLGNFSRTAAGGSFVVTGVPTGNLIDVFPPCKIIDLEVELNAEDEFLLSWTAPGDDYDRGKAERYEIKMSENPLELRNATFHNVLPLNTFGLKPEVAGTKQSFQYKSENYTKENGTMIYFAIRAIDSSNNTGEVSNIARAVVLLSPLPTITTGPTSNYVTADNETKNSALNNILIIIIACASIIISGIVL